MKKQSSVTIVGAGVAGSVLAAFLGKNGYAVTIVEQDWKEQDRIVGELLQPGGVSLLYQMGLEHLLQGIDAKEIEGYVLHHQESSTKILYPDTDKNILGRGFKNGRFVQNARVYISTLSSVNCISGKATRLLYKSQNQVEGIEIETEEGIEKIYSDLTIVSEGAFSKFRNYLSPAKPTITSFFLGILIDNSNMANSSFGQVILSETGPTLVYPVSSTHSRVLIDFQGSEAPRRGQELKTCLIEEKSKSLPKDIRERFIDGVQNTAIKCMPNNYLPVVKHDVKGVVLMGDSQNMRHPLTGGGMTAAFSNVLYLGNQILSHPHIFNEDKFYADYTRHAKSSNGSINILANALYEVMNEPLLRDLS